jgi:hypothetical protein
METFCPPKRYVDDPGYRQRRRTTLNDLDLNRIDAPLRPLVSSFCDLPFCYTLQCCFGHFVHAGQHDPHSLDSPPKGNVSGAIDYRIAYMALCLQNCRRGQSLHDELARIVTIDSRYIQFGCAEWFWQRHRNSFVLQVEPERYKHLDQASLENREARHIAKVRDQFFRRMCQVVWRNKPDVTKNDDR